MILTIQVAAISSPIGCYACAYLSRNTRNRQPEDDFPLVVYLCLLPPFNRKALPFGCAIPMRCCVSVTALCRSPKSSTFTGGRFTFSRHVSRRRFIHSRSSSSVHNSMTSIHRAAARRYSLLLPDPRLYCRLPCLSPPEWRFIVEWWALVKIIRGII